MLNKQPVQKPLPDNAARDVLSVHSLFYTIQGEGPFAGCPAVFVRLAGCNLQCPLCDTEYTNGVETMSISDIVEKCNSLWKASGNKLAGVPLIVLTGGEPFRQHLNDFLELAISANFHVQIETNGTIYREAPYHSASLSVVCSPKSHYVAKELVPHVSAWKYVATSRSIRGAVDGLPLTALEHPMKGGRILFRPRKMESIFLSPADEYDSFSNSQNIKACVESCLKNGYTLSLQTHKIIGVA
jgi:7-carboxy-7-deazaguanine synthase